jgi:hypothetical protein
MVRAKAFAIVQFLIFFLQRAVERCCFSGMRDEPEIEDILIDEVRRLFGNVSEMWIRRRLDPTDSQYDPDFPQPIQYATAGRRHWSRTTVLSYRDKMRQLTTERRLAHRASMQRERARRKAQEQSK